MNVFYQVITCRGVVQLFNAVKQQQRKVEVTLDEAGPSVRRQDKALQSFNKKQFIDVLKGVAPVEVKEEVSDDVSPVVVSDLIASCCFVSLLQLDVSEVQVKEEPVSSDDEPTTTKKKPSWNILRDDFLLGARMKDWNKESESEDDT
jgi:DUF438 domain-containing protein